MKPLISIVMAVYQGEKYLEAQIRSILEQTYPNIEVVIVDDGSTDSSPRIVEGFSRKDSRVKTHRNPKNLGLIKNFITSLRFAQGELICYSDQDDVWRKDKIGILSSLISKNARNMLAYSDMEICDADLKTTFPSFWKASGVRPRRGALQELALLRNLMPGCSMMFRAKVKECLLRVPPECSFMHDHLAFVLAASLGEIDYSREKLVKYRQHTGNNIGAFYPSVTDKTRFREQLRKEIRLLSPLLSADRRGLERFLDREDGSNIILRMSFIRYYLFLRPDTFTSKCLGFFECLFPDLYRRVQRGFHANKPL